MKSLSGRIAAALLIIAFCGLATWYVRVRSGLLDPAAVRRVQSGMTPKQVLSVLGEPHRRSGCDTESWYYDLDSPILYGGDPLEVKFDEHQHVNSVGVAKGH